MRLVPIDFTALARLEIAPLEITIDEEEILADLLYPNAPDPWAGRS
jgi:hypothetical protein